MKRSFWAILYFSLAALTACTQNEPTTRVITLSQTEVRMKPSDVVILETTVSPASSEAIVWTSSDETIVKVEAGLLTPQVANGTAVITASLSDASASCTVIIAQTEYQLVWEDDFTGSTINTEYWTVQTGGGGWGNNELQYYTDRNENIRVEDGNLVIQAKKETYETRNYTSGRMHTQNKKAFAYGKIEARINMPSGTGTWPAFWMLGYGTWPACGEIDIMEHVGKDPNMVSHALHTSKKNGNRGNQWNSQYRGLTNVENNYHVYGIEWEQDLLVGRDAIRFTVDGVQTAIKYEESTTVDRTSWPFNREFYIIVNLALGGNMGGTIDDNIFANDIIMKVDWIRVYQRP